MNCKTARRAMDAQRGDPNDAFRKHLADCEECSRLEAALRETREALRSRNAGIVPDAGFAARVRSKLHYEPAELLGLAALRLIPATLILLVLMFWLAFALPPQTGTGFETAPTDDVLAWVLEDVEDGS